MTKTVDAIYEKGTLRLMEPISLSEGTRVEVIIIAREPASKIRTPSEILSSIASMPMEADDKHFSGRDHDEILYGEKNNP